MPQCPEKRSEEDRYILGEDRCIHGKRTKILLNLSNVPLTSGPPNPVPPRRPQIPPDLSAGPQHPSFSQVGSSPRCALTETGPGTVRRRAQSAPAPGGPFGPRRPAPLASRASRDSRPGPGAALTAQQEEEAERRWSPRADCREPRAAAGALCPERGHRAASRRGGAAALSRPGRGRLYPQPQPQEAAPFPRRGWDGWGHVGGGGDARGWRTGGGVAAPPGPGARRCLRLVGVGVPLLLAHPAGLDSSPRNPSTGFHFLGSAAWRPGLARVSKHPLPGF